LGKLDFEYWEGVVAPFNFGNVLKNKGWYLDVFFKAGKSKGIKY